MPLLVKCPVDGCNAASRIDDSLNGRPVRCPKCGGTFVPRATLNPASLDTSAGTANKDPGRTLRLPAEFGRYRLLKLLGRGGMGAVYLAEDSTLHRKVALKMPFLGDSPSPQRVERFVREARAAAAVTHANICTIYDAGEIGGRPFLTMAYVEGTTLAGLIDPEKPMPQRQAAEITRKIALALAHAHRANIVHRDLKPGNVMMCDGVPVVMDFGLAKKLGESDEAKLTRAGGIVGTPAYMSPEQVGGADAVGASTDVYALGVILFEMLTGRVPFSGSLEVVIGRILAAPMPPVNELRADVDARLAAIVAKATAKKPEERYAGMAEFAAAIEAYLTRKAPPPVPTRAIVPAPLPDVVTNSPFGGLADEAKPAPRKRPRVPSWMVAVGLALLVPLVGLAALTVLRVETKDGTLVVEMDGDEVEARVKGGKLVLLDADGKVKYTLTAAERTKKVDAGAYKVRVEGADGLVLDTEEFTLRKGDSVTIRVKADPKTIAKKEDTKTGKTLTPSAALLALDPKRIPQEALALAGDGDAKRAPAGLVAALGEAVPIHRAPVWCVAFSRDGKWLASGSEDATIMLRDVATGAVKRVLREHTSTVSAVAFSKDGKSLLSSSFDGTMKLWPLDRDEKPTTILSDFGQYTTMTVSSDGSTVAAFNHTTKLQIWKWGEWDAPKDVPGVSGKIPMAALALSPKGEFVAVGGHGTPERTEISPVRVYSTNTGELKKSFELNAQRVHALAYSNKGGHLAGMGAVGYNAVWDLSSGKKIASPPPVGCGIANAFSASWSADDKFIAYTGCSSCGVFELSADKTITTRWEYTGKYFHGVPARGVAFSPSGHLLASGGHGGDVPVWDVKNWNRKYLDGGHRHFVESLSCSRNGTNLISVGGENAVMEWQLAGAQSPIVTHLELGRTIPVGSASSTVALNFDGTKAIVQCAFGIGVLDLTSRKEDVFRTPESTDGNTVISPDGKSIATRARHASLQLWDVKSGRMAHAFPDNTYGGYLAFSGDSRLLAAATFLEKKPGVTIWDLESCEKLFNLDLATPGIFTFSPDGKILATAHHDGEIHLWDLATKSKIRTLIGPTRQTQTLKFSPDGARIIASDNTGALRIWNTDQVRAKEIIPVGPANMPLIFDLDPSGKFAFVAGKFPVIFVLRLP